MSQLLEDLMDMVRCASVNPFEKPIPTPAPEEAMAQLYTAKLEALGLTVETVEVRDGRRNVWARLPGSGGGPGTWIQWTSKATTNPLSRSSRTARSTGAERVT